MSTKQIDLDVEVAAAKKVNVGKRFDPFNDDIETIQVLMLQEIGILEGIDTSEKYIVPLQEAMQGLSIADQDILNELFFLGVSVQELSVKYSMDENLIRRNRNKALNNLKTLMAVYYEGASLKNLFPDCIICSHKYSEKINAFLHLWYESNEGTLIGAVPEMPKIWGKTFINTILKKPRVIEQHIIKHVCFKQKFLRSQKRRLLKDKDDVVSLSFKLSKELKQNLDKVSDKYGISNSDLLRGSITFGLPLCLALFEQRDSMRKFINALGSDLLRDFIVTGKV